MQQVERATRDKERTRKAIIDAAALMIAERGAGVSLADIAAKAGVSKGALTHHFASRSALEDAVLSDVVSHLWAEVHAHVDLSENRPGKLLRGYIRALTSESSILREVFSPTSVLIVLGAGRPLEKMLERDAQNWREAFAQDGLDESMSLILRLAAEGLLSAAGTPYVTKRELKEARDRLLQLAEAG